MKTKRFLFTALLTASVMLLFASLAIASSGANLVYYETDLGNGTWQYDYTFNNNSISGDYLYSVLFNFSQISTISELTVPTGWDSSLSGFTPIDNDYIDYYSTDTAYDIAAGSSLGGFSFKTNSQVGSIAYTAYLDDYNGNPSIVSGTTTPIVPEPLSSVLFISGGAMLVVRRYSKRIKI